MSNERPRVKRDIWRMSGGPWGRRWGAEVLRPGGMGVGVRFVSLPRALWFLLTVRRPEEHGLLVGPVHDQGGENDA